MAISLRLPMWLGCCKSFKVAGQAFIAAARFDKQFRSVKMFRCRYVSPTPKPRSPSGGVPSSSAVIPWSGACQAYDGVKPADAVIRLTRNSLRESPRNSKAQIPEGDLGFGVGLTYRHRNIFHGSELLSIKARGSYESLSGNLEGLINNRYTEAGAEIAITLPKFRRHFCEDHLGALYWHRLNLPSTSIIRNGRSTHV